MKKKSIAARMGVVAMALTLATTSLTSGTLAKYTSSYTLDATAQVAAWNTELAVWDKANSKWKYSWEGDAITEQSLRDTVTGNVHGVAAGKIAPGMSGTIKLQVRNSSHEDGTEVATDVDTDYIVYVKPSSTDAPTHLKFSFGGTEKDMTAAYDTGAGDDATLGYKLTSGTIAASTSGTAAQRDINIDWNWDYQAATGATASAIAKQDLEDTTNGSNPADITYKITVIMTQANPNTSHTITAAS